FTATTPPAELRRFYLLDVQPDLFGQLYPRVGPDRSVGAGAVHLPSDRGSRRRDAEAAASERTPRLSGMSCGAITLGQETALGCHQHSDVPRTSIEPPRVEAGREALARDGA